MAVYRLEPDSIWFPDPAEADGACDGLLAVGGDYSPERLQTAYASGIFPWPVEAWQNGQLVGGFYGVAIGPCFFGESMFALVPDASKCAFATFARRMFDSGVPWIDCQVYTDHLARFGAKEIPRSEYLKMLTVALRGLS